MQSQPQVSASALTFLSGDACDVILSRVGNGDDYIARLRLICKGIAEEA